MNPILKNILAIIGGGLLGMLINMTLVNIGPHIIPLPEGVDVTTTEGLKNAMPLLQPKNFIPPFLAHALGTLAGAWLAAHFAATHKMKCALGVGVFFLIGGIAAVNMFGGPTWFIILDLVGAYIPMAWLGGKLAIGKANVGV